ncbi:hypothetical protein FCT18_14690 [Lysinibacillus sphaericus]|uniref:Transcriptional regulator n=1 Tax=Lysinibacillus sphaericus TaxID=1421 RepID=A0A2S0K652_LYSSH|nr:hypothetical protein [Lysinibacillus sphaericus]AVK98855.1 hypothetical protein LS41612_22475 [Lysinibacillus sphaericus]MED4545281.1 hypothetical protein [Lysinibacillus sphaericus]TKI18343.1 hypothetical protein FCT18_14690 [Lysinibacillus sphaericus]SUV15127.1 Uncharacterised protein [Lysinibacillus sphaericus]
MENIVKYWTKGTVLYPGDIKARTHISIETTYNFLNELTKSGYLEKRFELYCSECHKFKGKILKSLTDDLGDTSCDFCHHEFIVFKDTILIYEVSRTN